MSVIHLARFGNKGGAHGLLGHSGADPALLTDLKWHTDAPPQSDPQRLAPFVACYLLQPHFIAQATVPDASASRAGMVTTTAAIVALDDLAQLDLERLWTHLETGPPVDAPLDSQRFQLDAETIGCQHAPGTEALATELVHSGRAVWVGPGLRDALACLWSHLSPGSRSNLVVGFAVHPDVVPVPLLPSSIRVLTLPPGSADRWIDWGQAGIDTPVVGDPAAARALLGDDHGAGADLARALDLKPGMRDWRHLARASSLLQNLDKLDHEQVRSLIQLLGLLQPDSQPGVTTRASVSDRLRQLTPATSFDDVRGLRTLPWASLTDVTLNELVSAWVYAATHDRARVEDVVDALTYLIEVDAAADRASGTDLFAGQLATAMTDQLRTIELRPLMRAVTRRDAGHALVTWILSAGARRRLVDVALAAEIEPPGAPGWSRYAAANRLPRTHAAVVDVSDPARAWADHLAMAPRPQESDARLAARTGAIGVIASAIDLGHPELVDRAGALIAEGIADLPPGDVSDAMYRAVWESAARQGSDPWASVSPAVASPVMIELLQRGSPLDPVVVTALSRTSAADLARHPNRRHLWGVLPDSALPGFLGATAGSVARSLRPNDPAPEPVLSAAILDADVLGVVAHESATQALTVLAALPSATYRNALVVIRRARFTPAESTRLGQLVARRGWHVAAEAIDDAAPSRSDLRNAAIAVAPMFGLVDRMKRALRGGRAHLLERAETSELRDALQDLISGLYPDGPRGNGVWVRSGGDEADLPTASTGRLQWGQALDAILAGRRGAPMLLDLCAQVQADFPNNQDLGALVKWIEKRGAN